MANSILNRGSAPAAPQRPGTTPAPNPMQMMQQFQQFRNSFRGDPQQMVQQMLQSGRINEAQLQQATQMAKQFKHLIK